MPVMVTANVQTSFNLAPIIGKGATLEEAMFIVLHKMDEIAEEIPEVKDYKSIYMEIRNVQR